MPARDHLSLRRAWWVVPLAVIAALLLLVLVFGRERGVEICPQSLEEREYFCLRVPGLGWQIGPTYRFDRVNPLVNFLRQEKLLTARGCSASRWEPVYSTSLASPRLGDPWILSHMINLTDKHGKLQLLHWSQKNPELARIFWPMALEAIEIDRYDLLPRLYRLARGAEQAGRLREELQQHLTQAKEG